jgi:hypothetical protein
MRGEEAKAGLAVGHGMGPNLKAKTFLCMADGHWECEKILT